MPERRWGSERNFVVEHFRPKSLFPDLECSYSNLYYACNRCNEYKGKRWPTPEMEAAATSLLDPCQDDLYKNHVRLNSDGTVTALTSRGACTIDYLRLDREILISWRAERIKLRIDSRESNQAIDRLTNVLTEGGGKPLEALQLLVENHRKLRHRILNGC